MKTSCLDEYGWIFASDVVDEGIYGREVRRSWLQVDHLRRTCSSWGTWRSKVSLQINNVAVLVMEIWSTNGVQGHPLFAFRIRAFQAQQAVLDICNPPAFDDFVDHNFKGASRRRAGGRFMK